VLVPGAETAGPQSRDVHGADHDVLATDMSEEVDRTLEEDPPRVGVLTLPEQDGTRLEPHLRARRHELCELVVGHPVEQAEAAQIGHPGHVAAR